MLPALSSVYGPIRQVAYIVEDIDAAIENWNRQLGVSPFAVVRECKPLQGSKYRGEDSGEIILNLAFAYIGEVQLELIEQVNDTPSMYREALAKGASGLHHYGVCVEDYSRAYQYALDNGFTPVVNAGAPGYAQMAYVESDVIPGLILEIIEWNDITRPYFDGIGDFLAQADPKIVKHTYSL